jgi:hypothetical protein
MFLTWRLHGSLPEGRAFPSATTAGETFLAMDRLLDNAQTGPLYLRKPEIASMVIEAIRYRELTQYHLHCFVVMANHVHLLFTPDEVAQEIYCSRRQSDPGTYWTAFLAG